MFCVEQLSRPERRAFVALFDHLEDAFLRRHPWSFPGSYYSTTDNMGALGPFLAAGRGGLIALERGHEFIWRQPQDRHEALELMRALRQDEITSYGLDGCRRWTVATVGDWWAEREQRREAMLAMLQECKDSPDGYRGGAPGCVDRAWLLQYLKWLDSEAQGEILQFQRHLAEHPR